MFVALETGSSAPSAVTLAVLAAGALHAGWNAVTHRIQDRAVGFVLIGASTTLVSAFLVPWASLPAADAWPFLLGSVVLHGGYSWLLLRSYQLGDFTQMYPLARGTSPLVVAAFSVFVLGQYLTVVESVGVLAVCAGLGSVALGGRGAASVASRPAITAAVGTGLTIAAYTIVDGLGVRHAHSTAGYVVWLFLLQGPIMPIIVALRRGCVATLRSCHRYAVIGSASGLMSLAAYGIVIWAQSQANLATVAATREVSILFGAVIGRMVFRERFAGWRITGATLTVAGIVAINLG